MGMAVKRAKRSSKSLKELVRKRATTGRTTKKNFLMHPKPPSRVLPFRELHHLGYRQQHLDTATHASGGSNSKSKNSQIISWQVHNQRKTSNLLVGLRLIHLQLCHCTPLAHTLAQARPALSLQQDTNQSGPSFHPHCPLGTPRSRCLSPQQQVMLCHSLCSHQLVYPACRFSSTLRHSTSIPDNRHNTKRICLRPI
jgi:hypothetical protein